MKVAYYIANQHIYLITNRKAEKMLQASFVCSVFLNLFKVYGMRLFIMAYHYISSDFQRLVIANARVHTLELMRQVSRGRGEVGRHRSCGVWSCLRS